MKRWRSVGHRSASEPSRGEGERTGPLFPPAQTHLVFGRSFREPLPRGFREARFGMGCFWGAERLFWSQPGVHLTEVGYGGGHVRFPTYPEVCTGRTGHAELVRVVYDPGRMSFAELLALFFENHDPTQGMRQGNDIGSQYRSLIMWMDAEQRAQAETARSLYAALLRARGFGPITTEIVPPGPFYPAEPEHQQYLHRNPAGYCGLAGLGVPFPRSDLRIASRDGGCASEGSGIP